MYNKERKLTFANTLTQNSISTYSKLKLFEPYEAESNCDLCMLPVNVLQKAFDSGLGMKPESMSIYNLITLVKKYIEWCREQGFEVSNSIYSIEMGTDKRYRETMVSSPAHLNFLLNKVFDPVNLNTVDCLRRSVLWLLYFGLTVSEIEELKTDEVGLEKKIVCHNGLIYDIYNESLPALKKTCELTEFSYIHPDYNEVIKKKRVDGDFLLRGIDSKKLNFENTTRSVISRKANAVKVKLQHSKIYTSGIFYRMYMQETNGFTPNFLMYVVEKAKKDGVNRTEISMMQSARVLKKGYQEWKHAFYDTNK